MMLMVQFFGLLQPITEKFSLPLPKNYAMAKINRLKSILAEKNRTNLWLASQLGVNSTTVSKMVYQFFSTGYFDDIENCAIA